MGFKVVQGGGDREQMEVEKGMSAGEAIVRRADLGTRKVTTRWAMTEARS